MYLVVLPDVLVFVPVGEVLLQLGCTRAHAIHDLQCGRATSLCHCSSRTQRKIATGKFAARVRNGAASTIKGNVSRHNVCNFGGDRGFDSVPCRFPPWSHSIRKICSGGDYVKQVRSIKVFQPASQPVHLSGPAPHSTRTRTLTYVPYRPVHRYKAKVI